MAEVPIFLLLKFESFFIDALPKIVGIGTNVSGFNERESEDDFLSTMLTFFVAEMELCWNLNYLCVQPQFNQDFGLECTYND